MDLSSSMVAMIGVIIVSTIVFSYFKLTAKRFQEAMVEITHRCTYCEGYRMSDGAVRNLCGEPCSFIMGKGGSAIPEWGITAEGYRVNPCAPDFDIEAPFLHLVKR